MFASKFLRNIQFRHGILAGQFLQCTPVKVKVINNINYFRRSFCGIDGIGIMRPQIYVTRPDVAQVGIDLLEEE
jgi:hypothetical protein